MPEILEAQSTNISMSTQAERERHYQMLNVERQASKYDIPEQLNLPEGEFSQLKFIVDGDSEDSDDTILVRASRQGAHY